MPALLQLSSACVHLWPIRQLRPLRRPMQMPSWMGRYRLSYSSYATTIHLPISRLTDDTECDSLADGDQRRLREDGKTCECKEGWGGINCNGTHNRGQLLVSRLTRYCSVQDRQRLYWIPPSRPNWLSGFGRNREHDLLRWRRNCIQQPSDVRRYKQVYSHLSRFPLTCPIDRKIIDQLPGRPPQVTFSCEKQDSTCSFQFWTAQVESFYCALDTCTSETVPGYDTNTTTYACEHIKCSCVPGRFICGEDGSVDITDFLKEEIRGPATFSCKSGAGCRFEEPAMNDLILTIFGDPFISLQCEGGECLHYSQVPGYVVSSNHVFISWVLMLFSVLSNRIIRIG